MKFTKKRILYLIILLLALFAGYKVFIQKSVNTFSNYQLNLVRDYTVEDKVYSLAFDVGGITDKTVSIDLYDYDITPFIGTKKGFKEEYKSPVYEFLIDDSLDEDVAFKRTAIDAIWDNDKNQIIVFYQNGEREIFKY